MLRVVKISDDAVVGADAVVTNDVDLYTIVVGVPAKTIRNRFTDDIIKELLKLKWRDWKLEKIKVKREFY